LILKHDCIWPHGLNFQLHVDSLLEVSEFRKSCLRHHWPPAGDIVSDEIDLERLRQQVACGEHELILSLNSSMVMESPPKEKKIPPKPVWQDLLHPGKTKGLSDLSPDSLDNYALSIVSDAASDVTYQSSSSTDTGGSDITSVTCKTDRTYVLPMQPGSSVKRSAMQRPTSAGKARTGARPTTRKPTDSPRRSSSGPLERKTKSFPQKESPVKDDKEDVPATAAKRQLEIIIPTNGQEEGGSGSEEDLSKISKSPSLTSLSSLGEGIKENESPVVNPPTIAPGGTAMFIALDSPKRQSKTSTGRVISAKRPLSVGKGDRSRLPQVAKGAITNRR
jgi:hypothetical protein